MPSLKDLRDRIGSVKSTQKITSAMKMVAASKLRRAQEQAEASRPYAERMTRMMGSLAGKVSVSGGGLELMTGTGKDEKHLLVVITADRGLCGGFNTYAVREARRAIQQLVSDGKSVQLYCVGRKGYDQLKRDHGDKIVGHVVDVGRKVLSSSDAEAVRAVILDKFAAGEFDVCTLVYNRFKSVISQEPTRQQLIPLKVEDTAGDDKAVYEFEPDEEQILRELLPANLVVQIYGAMLESAAGEQGARMTAMDNATRNAGEMIKKLTLVYNRTRQATITKELIEIISGAEAL